MNISIVDNINSEMKRFRMSQETLCAQLGIGRKTFYEWKKKVDIPATKLLACAKIFNCTLDYLVRDVQIRDFTEPQTAWRKEEQDE